VGRPEGKRPLRRPGRRSEDNIKIGFQEVGWGGLDWIDVTQEKDRCGARVNAVMNLRVPLNGRNFGSINKANKCTYTKCVCHVL
jgi:hypothetical protein